MFDDKIITEIRRDEQLRVLRAAGIDRVDERIHELLATGKLSAGQVVAGYTRLLRDLQPPDSDADVARRERAHRLALEIVNAAVAGQISDEKAQQVAAITLPPLKRAWVEQQIRGRRAAEPSPLNRALLDAVERGTTWRTP